MTFKHRPHPRERLLARVEWLKAHKDKWHLPRRELARQMVRAGLYSRNTRPTDIYPERMIEWIRDGRFGETPTARELALEEPRG